MKYSQGHWNYGCSNSTVLFSHLDRTAASCGSQILYHPLFPLFSEKHKKDRRQHTHTQCLKRECTLTASHMISHKLTYKDVLKPAGVQLAIRSRVKAEPHHLEILDKLLLWWVHTCPITQQTLSNWIGLEGNNFFKNYLTATKIVSYCKKMKVTF